MGYSIHPCASSRPPTKPSHSRPGIVAPTKGRQHLLPGNLRPRGVLRAALKPGNSSIPRHSEGTQLSRTTESRKSVSVLSISKVNANA